MADEANPATSTNRSSFKGNLLFVNYDRGRETAPHRKAVFSHVQSEYRRWKRKEDARLLCESANIPAAGHKTSARPIIARPPPVDDGVPGDDPPVDNSEIEQEEARQYTYAPVTILKKGQSDPFNAFAIPIDSRVNFLMAYCRDVELPSVHRDSTNPKGVYSAEIWSSILDHFKEPYSAYAHLTRVASAIPVEANENSELAITALTFRGKVISLLGKKLAEEDAMRNEGVFGAISSMLRAEMYTNNVNGALFHAKMLAHMVQSGAVKMNPRRTFEAIYIDYQRAAVSFTRTSFDYHKWIPQYFAPVWSKVLETLPSSVSHAAVAIDLDETVEGDELRKIFINMRHLHAVFVLTVVHPTFATDAMRAYLVSIGVFAMGQALNHYLDNALILHNSRNQNVIVGRLVTHARVQSVMSLALLYWARTATRTDSYVIGENKIIFIANTSVLHRLRDAYADYDNFTLADATEPYSRCMLWALYIGAWSEQRQRLGKDTKEAERGWFGPRFGAHAYEMGLRSWRDVREVLLGLIHKDSFPPNGSLWFHTVLEKVEVPVSRV